MIKKLSNVYLLNIIALTASLNLVAPRICKASRRKSDYAETYQQIQKTSPGPENQQVITATQYCIFLNAVASTDVHNLYEKKAGDDSLTASVIREGTPGAYRYSVIAGKEDVHLSYLSRLTTARYCNWLANGQLSAEEDPNVTEVGPYDLSNIEKNIIGPSDNTSDFAFSESVAMPDISLACRQVTFSVSLPALEKFNLSLCNNKNHDDHASWVKTSLGMGIGIGAIIFLAPLIEESCWPASEEFPNAEAALSSLPRRAVLPNSNKMSLTANTKPAAVPRMTLITRTKPPFPKKGAQPGRSILKYGPRWKQEQQLALATLPLSDEVDEMVIENRIPFSTAPLIDKIASSSMPETIIDETDSWKQAPSWSVAKQGFIQWAKKVRSYDSLINHNLVTANSIIDLAAIALTKERLDPGLRDNIKAFEANAQNIKQASINFQEALCNQLNSSNEKFKSDLKTYRDALTPSNQDRFQRARDYLNTLKQKLEHHCKKADATTQGNLNFTDHFQSQAQSLFSTLEEPNDDEKSYFAFLEDAVQQVRTATIAYEEARTAFVASSDDNYQTLFTALQAYTKTITTFEKEFELAQNYFKELKAFIKKQRLQQALIKWAKKTNSTHWQTKNHRSIQKHLATVDSMQSTVEMALKTENLDSTLLNNIISFQQDIHRAKAAILAYQQACKGYYSDNTMSYEELLEAFNNYKNALITLNKETAAQKSFQQFVQARKQQQERLITLEESLKKSFSTSDLSDIDNNASPFIFGNAGGDASERSTMTTDQDDNSPLISSLQSSPAFSSDTTSEEASEYTKSPKKSIPTRISQVAQRAASATTRRLQKLIGLKSKIPDDSATDSSAHSSDSCNSLNGDDSPIPRDSNPLSPIPEGTSTRSSSPTQLNRDGRLRARSKSDDIHTQKNQKTVDQDRFFHRNLSVPALSTTFGN